MVVTIYACRSFRIFVVKPPAVPLGVIADTEDDEAYDYPQRCEQKDFADHLPSNSLFWPGIESTLCTNTLILAPMIFLGWT